MIERDYQSLKERIFLALESGLSLVAIADQLSCTPSALQSWLDGNEEIELSGSVHSFLMREQIKGEVLQIPFIRITPHIFIENVIIEAMHNRGVFALIGNSGIGKTASLSEIYQIYDEVKVCSDPDELEKYPFSGPPFSVVCVDNSEAIEQKHVDIICKLLDCDVSVVLAGTRKTIDRISSLERLSVKTVLRDIPGIDQSDVKSVLNAIMNYQIDEDALKKIIIISVPSMARLVLLLREAHRILKQNRKERLDFESVTEAKKSLIMMDGNRW